MKSRPFSYDELTPLEQCIANKFLFAQMLNGHVPERAPKKESRRELAPQH
jgi:hypothetical protein